ncbi:Uncharacterized protein HZ326_19601, partial [Fusarium oxysporum f. sp. albedinis]
MYRHSDHMNPRNEHTEDKTRQDKTNDSICATEFITVSPDKFAVSLNRKALLECPYSIEFIKIFRDTDGNRIRMHTNGLRNPHSSHVSHVQDWLTANVQYTHSESFSLARLSAVTKNRQPRPILGLFVFSCRTTNPLVLSRILPTHHSPV